MTAFLSWGYFELMLVLAVPTIAMAFWGKHRLMQAWILLSTLIVVLFEFNGFRPFAGIFLPLPLIVAGFLLWEWLVLRAFVLARKRYRSDRILYAAVIAASVPMIVMILSSAGLFQETFGFSGVFFMTFRALDALFCVGDGLMPDPAAIRYVAFLAFFPTITIGPIDRYQRFEKDWLHTRTRAEVLKDILSGIQRIFTGFLYKFIAAELIYRYWLQITPQSETLHLILFAYGTLFYFYFDLAGYSSFAIGTSYFFGIHTPENFNFPFFATNVVDFWRRYHMTYTAWLRDYVYSRFVFTAIKNAWFTSDQIASYIGYVLVMVLMKIILELNWSFIIAGLYLGATLICFDLFHRYNRQHNLVPENRWTTLLSIFVTLSVMSIGFAIGTVFLPMS